MADGQAYIFMTDEIWRAAFAMTDACIGAEKVSDDNADGCPLALGSRLVRVC